MPTPRERFDAIRRRRQRFDAIKQPQDKSVVRQGPSPERTLENIGGVLGGAPVSTERSKVPGIVKESALPIIGETIGFGLAGPAGEAGGAFIAEAANQFFGITPKSKAQLFLAAGAPLGLRAIGKVIKKGAKFIPGAGAGLAEKAIDDIAKKGLEIVPGDATPSRTLFNELEELNPFIHMKKTLTALDELIKLEQKSSTPDKALIRKFENLRGKIQASSRIDPRSLREVGRNGLDFQDLRADISDFGGLQGKASRAGDTATEGKFKLVGRALREDLEIAGKTAKGKAGLKLKAANKAFSKEKFQEQVLNLLDDKSLFPPPRPKDGLIGINTLSILKKLDSKAFRLARKTNPAEFKDLVKTIKAIRVATPPLPPIGGTPFGSGTNVLRLGVGGLTGAVTGNDPRVFATVNLVAMEATQRFMTTATGRKFIRFLVRDKKPLTIQLLAAGLQAVRNKDEFQPVIDIVDSLIQEHQQKSVDIQDVIKPSAPFEQPNELSFRQGP